LKPNEDGIKSGDLPVAISQQLNIEGQAFGIPEHLSGDFARMCEFAEDRERELLERATGLNNLFKQRDDV
jgi:hypothetical protein